MNFLGKTVPFRILLLLRNENMWQNGRKFMGITDNNVGVSGKVGRKKTTLIMLCF